MADLDDRPHKKRRFFIDSSPSQDPSLTAERSLPDEINDQPKTPSITRQQSSHVETHDKENVFDVEAFKAFTGADPPAETLLSLQKTFGNDLERAINAYFDGSWKSAPVPSSSSRTPVASTYRASPAVKSKTSVPATLQANGTPPASATAAPTSLAMKSMPSKRYIGALGVAGWTTRSRSSDRSRQFIKKLEEVGRSNKSYEGLRT
jgi:DNA repair protein RAD5